MPPVIFEIITTIEDYYSLVQVSPAAHMQVNARYNRIKSIAEHNLPLSNSATVSTDTQSRMHSS
jgi:sulfur relay (sulfurtransferase) DsrC/TusE family protein